MNVIQEEDLKGDSEELLKEIKMGRIRNTLMGLAFIVAGTAISGNASAKEYPILPSN